MEKGSGETVGALETNSQPDGQGNCEIGYGFIRAVRGQGQVTEDGDLRVWAQQKDSPL